MGKFHIDKIKWSGSKPNFAHFINDFKLYCKFLCNCTSKKAIRTLNIVTRYAIVLRWPNCSIKFFVCILYFVTVLWLCFIILMLFILFYFFILHLNVSHCVVLIKVIIKK